MDCRHCHTPLEHDLINLGSAPPSNAYLTKDMLNSPEIWYPLRVKYCDKCWLVQTEDFTERELLFNDTYAYFSSMSKSWLKHARDFAIKMQSYLNLSNKSLVVEVAANDGYLLRNFVEFNIPCIGIEPTKSCAMAAQELGINVIEEFFSVSLAETLLETNQKADLVIANNVLAHVPDINDFVSGIALLLKDSGVVTFEFPHVMKLVNGLQFDTIYHEHFSYLSLITISKILASNGLTVFDVEELTTHGGSLRVYAQKAKVSDNCITDNVTRVINLEKQFGMDKHKFYSGLQKEAEQIKDKFLMFLINAKKEGKLVAAYGAAAKGNTLLNFAGIKSDLISFIVDASPMKVGRYTPGSHIPIVDETKIRLNKPDYIVIIPWNICDEIMEQIAYIKEWGGEFVTVAAGESKHIEIV